METQQNNDRKLMNRGPREWKTAWSSMIDDGVNKRYVGHDYENIDYNVGKNKIEVMSEVKGLLTLL